jgi:hypothetical protein
MMHVANYKLIRYPNKSGIRPRGRIVEGKVGEVKVVGLSD